MVYEYLVRLVWPGESSGHIFCKYCGDRLGSIGGARISQTMALAPTSARGRRGGISNMPLSQPTIDESQYVRKLNSQGIYCHHARYPQKCQMCWKHVSRVRRKCPTRERFIAPRCWPML